MTTPFDAWFALAGDGGTPRPDHIGNPLLPSLHGGAVGALAVSAGRRAWPGNSAVVSATVSYLRPGRADWPTFARAQLVHAGRRFATVTVVVEQAAENGARRAIASALLTLRRL